MAGLRFGRRAVLRAGAAAVGAMGMGGAVAGRAAAADRPALRAASPVTEVTFMPWWPYGDTQSKSVMNEALAQFGGPGRQGVRLKFVPGPESGGPSSGGVLTSILAGTGPDIVGDCCGAWTSYLKVGAFADLTPYLTRDNIPLTTWSAGHIAALAEGGKQYGLPLYDGPVVYAYRQDILDTMGLPYPDPSWTYKDAAKLWRQATGTIQGTHTHRFGADFLWYPGYYSPGDYLFRGFGGNLMDASRTRCLLNEPPQLQAGDWLEPLFWDTVVTAPIYQGMLNGLVVFEAQQGNLPVNVTEFGTKFKWDYMPVPLYPNGRATFSNNDFWGMNALAKHPEAAWEALKWLAAEDTWQSFLIHAALLQPGKLSLWDLWESTVVSVAPIMRDKAIHWIKDAAVQGYAYPQEFFAYEPTQAWSLLANGMTKVNARQVSVQAGYGSIASQVNALEANGPRVAAEQKSDEAKVQSFLGKAKASATAITFPAPPVVGLGAGQPPSKAPTLVKVGASGHITLLAQSAGGIIGQDDNCTFAGSAYTSSQGTFICRLASVSLPKGGAIAGGAKIGLMARASLSNSAAMVAIMWAGQHGVLGHTRALDNLRLAPEIGLLPASAVQVAKTPPSGGNWLSQPLWFKMELDANVWTPSTSFNGKNWTAAGTPQTVQFVGAWVGVFATSHASGQEVQAVFDHAQGFTPTQKMQIGTF